MKRSVLVYAAYFLIFGLGIAWVLERGSHLEPGRAEAGLTAPAARPSGDSSGVMRRSNRNVTRSGTTLVLIPPLISPTVICGLPMPGVGDTFALSVRRQA